MSKFCTNCGQELEQSVKFCINCGKNVKNKIEKCDENINSDLSTFSPKSKIIAGLLAIIFGSFGIHNFYLGYNGKAVAQLLMTLLGFGALSLVSTIWGLIEGIMIFIGSINEDATGNPLTN